MINVVLFLIRLDFQTMQVNCGWQDEWIFILLWFSMFSKFSSFFFNIIAPHLESAIFKEKWANQISLVLNVKCKQQT